MKLSLRNGLFLGLAAGALSALLSAPKSGKELRHDLKDKLNSVPYHFFNLLESLVDLTASVLDFAKTTFREQSDKLSDALSCGISAAKERSQELRKTVSKTITW